MRACIGDLLLQHCRRGGARERAALITHWLTGLIGTGVATLGVHFQPVVVPFFAWLVKSFRSALVAGIRDDDADLPGMYFDSSSSTPPSRSGSGPCSSRTRSASARSRGRVELSDMLSETPIEWQATFLIMAICLLLIFVSKLENEP